MVTALLLQWVAGEASALDVPIVFVQEPVSQTAVVERLYPGAAAEGSRIVRLDPDGSLSVLTGPFTSAADPCVSFDGTRLLFAGRREPADPWDIWEMDVGGGAATQVTRNLGDCREPAYLPMAAVDAPNFSNKVRWITFASTAPGVLNDQGAGPVTSLYALSLQPVPGRGTVLWRTTYNLGGDSSPVVLADGRVLFSARQRGATALMTISWSGENLNPLYGSHDGMLSQTQACEAPDRTIVFVECEAGWPERGGRLAQISLRRPLASHWVLSDGRYRTPHPLGDRKLLVASAEGDGSFGLYMFDRATGEREQAIYDAPEWNDIDALPIAPTPEPVGRIPMVEFASVLDVGGLRTLGQLQCLNVYDSDRSDASRPGEVRSVRFLEGVPRSGARDAGGIGVVRADPDSTWPPPGVDVRILGEAPVEKDGSFYVNVAGDVPFYLQTLDGQGRALQTMRAWIWVRKGDQRGCIGCHEDKELAPENRATDALVRAAPVTLADSPDSRPTVGFARDVMPILERRCFRCHGTEAPAWEPVLSAEPEGVHNQAYAALLGLDLDGSGNALVRPGSARTSPLVDLLIDHGSAGAMTEEERRTVITWIDLGARWDD